MATAKNQNLNKTGDGQQKQNYTAVRYGTEKGSIKFGHIHNRLFFVFTTYKNLYSHG